VVLWESPLVLIFLSLRLGRAILDRILEATEGVVCEGGGSEPGEVKEGCLLSMDAIPLAVEGR
jgi:hypothetical protein